MSSHDKFYVFVVNIKKWEGNKYFKVERRSFKDTQSESRLVNPEVFLNL